MKTRISFWISMAFLSTGCATVSRFDVEHDDSLIVSRIEADFPKGDTRLLLNDSPTWNKVFDLHFESDSVEIEARSQIQVGNRPVLFEDRQRQRLGRDQLREIQITTGKGSGFRKGFHLGLTPGALLGLDLAKAIDENSTYWGVTPIGYLVISAASAAMFGVVVGAVGELLNLGHREKAVYRFAAKK